MFKINYDKKITMVQGDTGVIRMRIHNYELSQGDEVRFAIVNKANPSILLCQHSDKKIVLEKQVTVFEKDGSARIVIQPYDTEYLQPGKYLYEIQVKTKDSRVDTVVPLTSFTLMDGSIQGEYGQTTPSKPEPTPSEIELRFKRIENEIIPELGTRVTNVENEIDSISSSLDDVKNYSSEFINLFYYGCTENNSDSEKNTQIINNLISKGKNLLIPNMVIPINAPIIIPSNYKGIIKGLTKKKSVLKMITNSVNIIEFRKAYQTTITGVLLDNFSIEYSEKQKTKGCGIYFTSSDNKKDNWGYFDNAINIEIKNAYDGITTDGLDPVWNCSFDIKLNNIFNNGIKLHNANGQLGNKFYIKCMRPDYVDNTGYIVENEFNNSDCLYINGEYMIDYLDIEDWKGSLIKCESGNFILNQAHIERCLCNINYGSFFQLAGDFIINDIRLYNCTNNTSYFSLFKLLTEGSSISINNLIYDEKVKATYQYLFTCTNVKNKVNINNYRGDIDIIYPYENGYNSRDIIITGKNFLKDIRTFETAPTFDVNIGEIFKNKFPSQKDWVALGNGYSNTSLSCVLDVKGYNNTLNLVSGSLDNIKLFDALVINDISDNIYIVKSKTSSSITIRDYKGEKNDGTALINANANSSVRKASPQEVLVKLS